MALSDAISGFIVRNMGLITMCLMLFVIMKMLGLDESLRDLIWAFTKKKIDEKTPRNFWKEFIKKYYNTNRKLNTDREKKTIWIVPKSILRKRKIGKFAGVYTHREIHLISIKINGLIRNKKLLPIMPEYTSGYSDSAISLYIRGIKPDGPFLFPILDDNFKELQKSLKCRNKIGDKKICGQIFIKPHGMNKIECPVCEKEVSRDSVLFETKEDVYKNIRNFIDKLKDYEMYYHIVEEEAAAIKEAMEITNQHIDLYDDDKKEAVEE